MYTDFSRLFDSTLDEIIKDFGSTPTFFYSSLSSEEKKAVNATVCSELPYNMVTDKNTLFVTFALAGVDKNDVDIELLGRQVTITVKPVKTSKEKQVFLHKGLKCPSDKELSMSVSISEKFDCSLMSVEMTNGLLTISVPLKEEQKPVKIKF